MTATQMKRNAAPEPTFEQALMTPEWAQDILNKQNTSNRTLREDRVNSLAKDILAGNWYEDGMPVRFASDGTLLDGQHRLAAIARAGVAVPLVIASNIDSKAFVVMDSGLGRSWVDNMKGMDPEINFVASAALALIYRLESGALARNLSEHLSAAQRLVILQKHSGIKAYLKHSSAMRTVMPAATYVALAYLFHKQDPVLAEWFFESLEHGEKLNNDMGVYWLRNRLLTERGKLKVRTIVALTIKAWNAHRQGSTAKMARFHSNEDFPTIQ